VAVICYGEGMVGTLSSIMLYVLLSRLQRHWQDARQRKQDTCPCVALSTVVSVHLTQPQG